MALVLGCLIVPARADGTVIDLATQAPSLLIAGDVRDENLGVDLTTGDLDGDGIDDLVIGAPLAAGPDTRDLAGRVYVFFGGEDRPDRLNGDDADVTIFGADAGDEIGGGAALTLGLSTLAIGDINDDGFDDLVIGAPDAQDGGEVHIVFGRSRLDWDATPTIDLADNGDVLIQAADAFDKFGSAVAVGDINGDDIADLAAGAYLADVSADGRLDAGKVYVFWGRASWDTALSAATDASLEVLGAQSRDSLGSGLAVGQLDGAGPADLAMGAIGLTGGEVDVLFGAPTLSGTRDLATTPADWIVVAADGVDRIGRYLAVGDVSGDGQPDLVIGAPGAKGPTNAWNDAGEVAVVFGPTTAGTSDLADDADFVLYGLEPPNGSGDRVGNGIALGDLNGDGVQDLIAGARQGDGLDDTQNNAGEAYIVFGGDRLAVGTLSAGDADIVVYGQASGGALGRVAADNFDNVSPDDLVLGSHRADVGDGDTLRNAGKVYVLQQQGAEPTPTATSTSTPGIPTPTVTPSPTSTSTPAVTVTPTSYEYLPLIMRSE